MADPLDLQCIVLRECVPVAEYGSKTWAPTAAEKVIADSDRWHDPAVDGATT